MQRRVRWALGAFFTALVVAMGWGLYETDRFVPVGTGYAASDLCSRALYAGVALDVVRDDYVAPAVKPLPRFWQVSLRQDAPKAASVRTTLWGMAHPQQAIARSGLGCTVITPSADDSQVRAQAFQPVLMPEPSTEPWPRGEGDPETLLLSEELDDTLRRHAFALWEDQPEGIDESPQNTTAILIAHDGHLIHERYATGYARQTLQLGWSMTKTVTALVAGIFTGDGLLSLDGSLGLPEFRGTDKDAISLRHLLTMSSGLSWRETHAGFSDASEMLFLRPDQGAFVAAKALEHEPGTYFAYSTGSSGLAMLRMRQALGGSLQAIYDFYQKRLFLPLGIRDGVIEVDASGTPIGGARGLLRPVDWLRVGQLIASGGAWGDDRIVPSEHVRFMVSPSAAEPAYGGSLWLRASDMVPEALRARFPEDLIWLAGHQGQFVIIVPSRQLVVLRMGVTAGITRAHGPARDRVFALVADLLDALPLPPSSAQ